LLRNVRKLIYMSVLQDAEVCGLCIVFISVDVTVKKLKPFARNVFLVRLQIFRAVGIHYASSVLIIPPC
jgi:hypothetical protein